MNFHLIKKFLFKHRNYNLYGLYPIEVLINGYNFISLRLIPSKIFIKYKFEKTFGHSLNLEEPKTFNEKLQWKKFYDKKEIYSSCSDKYAVRDYIKNKIGWKYLIPLIYVTENPEEINFSSLPSRFIIKSNHGSNQNIIIKKKEDINPKNIVNTCNKWLKTNYYHCRKEWQYKNIHPKIIIERLLLDSKGDIPSDYKFHCFNGKVEFIQVDTGRFENHKRSYFNTKWELLPFILCASKDNHPCYMIDRNVKKPKKLKGMIEIAKILSRDFNYVRVDLYNIEDKIYFGELTFSHGSGFETFFPEKYDRIYGGKIKIKNEAKKQ